MKTGVPNKKAVQQFFHKLSVEPDNSLSVNGLNRVPSADQVYSASYNDFYPGKHVEKDKLDYDLNLAVKMDYIIFYNYLQIIHAWKSVVMNQCELQRTQKQMILIFATQNNRLAGFMLTGNCSMFLDNDGSIGRLCHCPKRNSPPKVLA